MILWLDTILQIQTQQAKIRLHVIREFHIRIQKQQLKFWLSLQNYTSKFPDSALKHLLDVAIEHDLAYVKWYQSLESKYGTPENSRRSLETEFKAKWKRSFDNTDHDVDSRLGTYHQVNPTLSASEYINKILILTIENYKFDK